MQNEQKNRNMEDLAKYVENKGMFVDGVIYRINNLEEKKARSTGF